MGILTSLLTLPLTGPVKGAWWLAEKLHEHALEQMNDPAEIKREIARLEQAMLAGEITEEAYEEQELLLLTRLRDLSRGR